jgi:hypothetical protein
MPSDALCYTLLHAFCSLPSCTLLSAAVIYCSLLVMPFPVVINFIRFHSYSTLNQVRFTLGIGAESTKWTQALDDEERKVVDDR